MPQLLHRVSTLLVGRCQTSIRFHGLLYPKKIRPENTNFFMTQNSWHADHRDTQVTKPSLAKQKMCQFFRARLAVLAGWKSLLIKLIKVDQVSQTWWLTGIVGCCLNQIRLPKHLRKVRQSNQADQLMIYIVSSDTAHNLGHEQAWSISLAASLPDRLWYGHVRDCHAQPGQFWTLLPPTGTICNKLPIQRAALLDARQQLRLCEDF